MINKELAVELIEKLESFSLKKQFLVLFFIATWDAWVMPALSIGLLITGLGEISFFQAEYNQFLWNNSYSDVFQPRLITEPMYYHIYIYIYFLESLSSYIFQGGESL